MSWVTLSAEEKVLVNRILSTGAVPEVIEINPSDYLSHSDINLIEEFASRNNDRSTRTFINNILRDNK